jgi:hypothetical protein
LHGLKRTHEKRKHAGKRLAISASPCDRGNGAHVRAILQTLAPGVETRMIAEGGRALEDHWQNAETRKVVREGTWDYVVLQEHSSLAETFIGSGVGRVNSDATFRTYAEMSTARAHETSG